MSAPEKNAFAGKKTIIIFLIVMGSFLGISLLVNNIDGPRNTTSKAPTNDQELMKYGAFIFPQPINLDDVPFINEEGKTVTKADNVGKWSFIFFGYTFCPDICPTTLAVMQQMWVKLDPKYQEKTQVVLVSVDTERDTPEVLKTYMDYFDPSFTAFTAKPESLRSFATQLNAVYTRVDRLDEKGEIDLTRGYLMDHSANITILDPDGNYYGFIKPPFNPKKMLSIVNTIQSN